MSKTKPANDEMIQGYMDGYDLTAPEPSTNRSYSYRHGFIVGRAEKKRRRLPNADVLRAAADAAMEKDEAR